MDDGLIEGVGAMTRFVNLLVADPETSRVPFMIDSSKVVIPVKKYVCAMSPKLCAKSICPKGINSIEAYL